MPSTYSSAEKPVTRTLGEIGTSFEEGGPNSATKMEFSSYAQAHTIDVDPIPGLDTMKADAIGLLPFSSVARLAARSSTPGATRANITLIRDELRFVRPTATTLALGIPIDV